VSTNARQAGSECRRKNLKLANMGLKWEASQPLNTRKLINVIILGPCKIKESQDQRSTTVNRINKLRVAGLMREYINYFFFGAAGSAKVCTAVVMQKQAVG